MGITRGRLSAVAVPLPNPELTTTPGTPLAPPVPLPYPGPEGRSKLPRAAMLAGLPWPALAGIPFGSPKPPVCTCVGARAVVGVAELPVENTLVFTACLGITGAELRGSGSSFLGAMLTVGAGASSNFTGVFGCGAGRRKALGGGSRLATTTGLNLLAGCG